MQLALKMFASPRVQNLCDRLVPSARWLQQRGQQALDNRTLSTRMRTSAGDKRRRVCSKGRGANFAGRLRRRSRSACADLDLADLHAAPDISFSLRSRPASAGKAAVRGASTAAASREGRESGPCRGRGEGGA